MNKRVLLIILTCACLLSGCLGSGARSVDAVSEPDFRAFAKAMQPELTRRNLLNSDGTWTDPLLTTRSIGLAGSSRAGQTLLDRLSPAFRFPNLSAESMPTSFRQTFTPDTKIEISRTGFTAMQGADEIHVGLVATLDWNDDGREDWLVLCRISPNAVPGNSRGYYLLIEDTRSEVLRPQVLGYLDCANYMCQYYLPDGSAPVFIDSNATVFSQGQQAITAPPQAAPPSTDGPSQTRLSN